LKYKF